MMIILHFFPLNSMSVRKFDRWGKVSSVEQGCLTCCTVLGLRLKLQLKRQKNETMTDAQSVEQKDVDNLLVTVSFSLDEETIQQICSNPDPATAFNVMVRRRRAEVKVSTLSAEQKRELVKAKDKELNTFVKYSLVEAGITSRDLTVCVDENALGCDVQRCWFL